ncbi:acetyl-CoA carboxylase biotin carboxyl carrier protein [Pallidibacillus pasinlerensis]|uniref:Biotin carboxyl carrier protein of acetyl-CoA carboxylase n=1 Tax=Pallidibacillus pasinlerensis TaxID=2703818 RepID=A0ABX0A051_9BACI|nr:acetyl-CoA carboxylase biotin carboxyl carrier protein [Pallidibacillus pasinlerensis]NCU16783.1 acetyl-CoA carboxylase biotin carboxyl carrier protein [Pallidibacillus pasinlerensis]
MLKIQEIRELIRLVDQSSLDEFKLQHDGLKITMKKNKSVVVNEQPVTKEVEAVASVAQPVTQPVEQATPSVEVQAQPKVEQVEAKEETSAVVDENLHKITSPMVGTFYRKPNPDAEPYVKVGDKVNSDTIVCIVEAMKLFNEIEAEVEGEIVEILVEDGQLVEFGQPLFLVKTN